MRAAETEHKTSRFKSSLMVFVRQGQDALAEKIRTAPFHPLVALIHEAGCDPHEIFANPELEHLNVEEYLGSKKAHPVAWTQKFPDPQDILTICDQIGMHPSLLWATNRFTPMPESLLQAQLLILHDKAYPVFDHNIAYGSLRQERSMGQEILKRDKVRSDFLRECEYAYDEMKPRPLLSLRRNAPLTDDVQLSAFFGHEDKESVSENERERFVDKIACAVSMRNAYETARCEKAAHLKGRNELSRANLLATLKDWYEGNPEDAFQKIWQWTYKNRKERNLESKLVRLLTQKPDMFGTFKTKSVDDAGESNFDAQLDNHFYLKDLGLLKMPREDHRIAHDDEVKRSCHLQREWDVKAFVNGYIRFLLRGDLAMKAANEFMASARANRTFRNVVSSPEFSHAIGFHTNDQLLDQIAAEQDCGPVVMSAAEERALLRELREENRRHAIPAYD
ncbi:MAG: hypothetical protein AB7E85_00860 [Pseudobdellovibrionaceae bacterium]